MERVGITMTPAKLLEAHAMQKATGASSLSEVIRLALRDLRERLAEEGVMPR